MKEPIIRPAEIKKPSGGGSIQGIGETFKPDAFTGTGTYTIPISLTPARGFEPSLQLQYNSGSGNGPFGTGFSLSLPSITRRTEKGIPRYNDTDVFLFSGVELTPALQEKDGVWIPVVRTVYQDNIQWEVRSFKPRTESGFNNIEQWIDTAAHRSHWKIISRTNDTTIYGITENARIADPNDAARIFEWLPETSNDAKGNRMLYQYKKEETAGAAHCLASIQYGNYYNQDEQLFFFELVADYGERDVSNAYLAQPNCDPYTPSKAPDTRTDPFSSFKSSFDIRHTRLCKHLLLFHHIDPGEKPCLVKRYSCLYHESPVVTTMQAFEASGCRRNEDGSYQVQSVPPVTFTFSGFHPPKQPVFHPLQAQGHTIPGYLNTGGFLPVDLWGEGLPGFLFSNTVTSMYLEPLGKGQYTSPEVLNPFPVNKNVQGGEAALTDLDGNKKLSLSVAPQASAQTGFYALQHGRQWKGFQPFDAFPTDYTHPDMEQASLSANGKTDLLLANTGYNQVYTSTGTKGYDAVINVQAPAGFPLVKKGYEEELVTFADLLGDGLPHRIRIADKQVECWPDMGYGRFGEKRILANAPAYPGGLNNARLFLADLDGSGTTDLIYVYHDRIEYFINQSGNSFADGVTILLPEPYGNIDAINFADINGRGATALVFSKMAPVPRHYYYEFTGETTSKDGLLQEVIKPYLLMEANNNRGASVHFQYCSSVKFYLEDKKAGKPWITQLPFPVQVVEQITLYDEIAKTRLVNTFTYHEGYYDPIEKTFCGFGYIERRDTETFDNFTKSRVYLPQQEIPEHLYVAPVYTRSWYYTGADDSQGTIMAHYKKQFYQGDVQAYDFPASVFTGIDPGDKETLRQAYFALKGQPIRTEVYGLDDEPGLSENPYTITASNNQVTCIQPRKVQRFAVLTVVPREGISYAYERNPRDPHMQQTFSQSDAFANIKNTCIVNLPRRTLLQAGAVVYPEQQAIKCVASHTDFFNRPGTDWQQIGIQYQARQYEITGLNNVPNKYLSFDYIQQTVFARIDPPTTSVDEPGIILQNWEKIFFWNDNQDDFLPLGAVTARALVHHQRVAVFSTTQISELLGDLLPAHMIRENGGYFEEDGYWWNTGLAQYYYHAQQLERFYLPYETRVYQPIASDTQVRSRTTMEYEPFYFSVVQVKQWLSETEYNETSGIIDYQHFQLRQVADLNNNRWQALFDALGHVTVQTLFKIINGQITGGMRLYAEGDAPAEYQVRTHGSSGGPITFEDVTGHPDYYLQGATHFFFYDLFAWMNAQQPLNAIDLQRDLYYHAAGGTTSFSCQQLIVYSDGMGRTLESKLLAEEAKWETSGRTVYNNKGEPCEQYLPFFSDSPYYESSGTKPSVPPATIYYDPLMRVIKTVNPAGYFSSVVFTPWEEKHYDEDDNDLFSPFYHTPVTSVYDVMQKAFLTIEDNLGKVFQNTFDDIVKDTGFTSLQLWNELVLKGYLAPPSPEDQYAWVTAKFQPYQKGFVLELDTPYNTVAQPVQLLLKQQCLTSYHAFDIQGRETLAIDARLYYSNVTQQTSYHNFRYVFGMAGTAPLCTDSTDGGKSFFVTNSMGNEFWALSPRLFNQLTTYDWLQRKTTLQVKALDANKQVLSDNLVEVFTYGETQPDAQQHNLRGALYELKDQSGIIWNTRYGLQDELIETTRQLTRQYKVAINWRPPLPVLDDPKYSTRLTYDALQRLRTQTTPDETVTLYGYNQRGLINFIAVKYKEAIDVQPVVTAIDYDASKLRTRIAYANGSQTTYMYEATTLRLQQLRTTRAIEKNGQKQIDDKPLQDITYTYDPVGNITRVEDRSFESVFNNNQEVSPVSEYVYDALYRLVKASGRQHPGINASTFINNRTAGDFKQSKYFALPNDSNKLENYIQHYTYDDAGNLVKTAHQATRGWSREMLPATDSNRINKIITADGIINEQELRYDRSGNQKLLFLNNSVDLTWSCCENLISAKVIERPDELDDCDYYNYDSGEMRVRKVSERMAHGGAVTESEKKIYLGNYEEKIVARVTAGSEIITMHRQTLRVMAGESCVAIIHYWVKDPQKEGQRQQRYQLSNHQGSASMELDVQAQLISYEEYFPYGGTAFIAGENQAEVALKDYRYSGKERDDSTGLYYYGARYYAPWLGRWLSPDPAGRVDGMNLYAFVKGNPIANIDKTGYAVTQVTLQEELDKRGYKTKDQGDLGLVHYGVNLDNTDARYESIKVVGGITMEAPWNKMKANPNLRDISKVKAGDKSNVNTVKLPKLTPIKDIDTWTQNDIDTVTAVYKASTARGKENAATDGKGIKEGTEFSKRSFDFNLKMGKTVIFHLDLLNLDNIIAGVAEKKTTPKGDRNVSNSVTAKEFKYVLRLPKDLREQVIFTRFDNSKNKDVVVDVFKDYAVGLGGFYKKHPNERALHKISDRKAWLDRNNLDQHYVDHDKRNPKVV